jgi:hypothetical protein
MPWQLLVKTSKRLTSLGVSLPKEYDVVVTILETNEEDLSLQ